MNAKTNFIVNDKKPRTVAEFKAHICRIMRERETGKKFSIVGGPRADQSVVRGNKTYGNN